jgi:D-glycero-D-manno-heptose 1,7-bisphosphate phosphatase
MKKPAVFLDRDGTINEQMGYINHISRFKILDSVHDAIRLLNENGYYSIILSNQSGVARGYFPIELVDEIHTLLTDSLRNHGAYVDGFFFCPHYPRGDIKEYRVECDCRKPKTGLIEKACDSFDIDIARSYMVGDRYTDIEFAHRAGLKGVMVRTGYGLGDIEYIVPKKKIKPDHISDNLIDAVKWIIIKEKREGV